MNARRIQEVGRLDDDGMRRLVERVAAGDARALDALYSRLSAPVYGLALRITHDRGAADEVVVDTFWQVWRQAARYDAARGGPIAWILTITRSRALDRRRSGERALKVETCDDLDTRAAAGSPEQDVWLSERAARVRAVFAELPARQQRALELAYFEGLTHTEVAERLGEPLGTVKTRIRSALARMRGAIEQDGLR